MLQPSSGSAARKIQETAAAAQELEEQPVRLVVVNCFLFDGP
jgi:hypothetical protein